MNIARTQNPINQQLRSKNFAKSGNVEVTYQRPLIRMAELGEMPIDHLTTEGAPLENPIVMFADGVPETIGASEGRLEHVDKMQPVLADGKAVLESKTQTFKLGPVSKSKEATKFGIVGALAGAVVGGALAAAAVVAAPVALAIGVGAAALGTVAAGMGAKSASGKETVLNWVEVPIQTDTMVGFKEAVSTVTSTETNEPRTAFTYTEILEQSNHGAWLKPIAMVVDKN